MTKAFHFYTRLNLVRLLGLKAHNPTQLLEGLKTIPAASVYFHTHRFLQHHSYLSPEPPNDFAYWLTNILNLKGIGEEAASLDIISFSIEELREEFIKILTKYILTADFTVKCQEGQEFHFMSCVTFVLPTPYQAHNVKEFAEVVRKISTNSLYFHVFEAPKRLGRSDNDFTAWLKTMNQTEAAEELSRLDPYNMTLEGLREKIIKAVNKYA